jgi:hypothetical protein
LKSKIGRLVALLSAKTRSHDSKAFRLGSPRHTFVAQEAKKTLHTTIILSKARQGRQQWLATRKKQKKKSNSSPQNDIVDNQPTSKT